MQSNKEHHYAVNLSAVNEEAADHKQSLSFAITNHDDLMQKMSLVEGKLQLSGDEEKAFLFGLKMFSEVVLKNRHKSPYDQMFVHMKSTMQLLKNHIKQKS